MKRSSTWDPCIYHRGQDAVRFAQEFFADQKRRVVAIGGAGFDPRCLQLVTSLSASCGPRLSGFFIREHRPNPSEDLKRVAEKNDQRIRDLVAPVDVFEVDVFDIDNAPVGGRRATQSLHSRLKLGGVTDIVLDCSALSVGLMFPLARYCLEVVRQEERTINFHIFVLDDPATDSAIRSTSCGKAAPLHGFNGGLSLEENTDAAKMWLPQLGSGRREVLMLIHQHVQPHAVCPILPFPSGNPRTGDTLIEEYGDLFEANQMAPTWHVDARDLVYAHEKNPVDLYRSILKIDDARRRVFAETGGSQLILSPLGSKAVAIGLLMAALERGFAVVSVESIEYRVEPGPEDLQPNPSAELVHVWLHGEAYPFRNAEGEL